MFRVRALKNPNPLFPCFQWFTSSPLSVDIAPVPHANDSDDQYIIIDRIKDAVSALPNPIPLLARQLFASGRSRIFGQRPDGGHDVARLLFGYPR